MSGSLRRAAGVGLLLVGAARADDPPEKLTPAEREELEAKWDKLDDAGGDAYQSGKFPEAQQAWEAALELARRLSPAAEFPDGHANLATSLNNLGFLFNEQGRPAAAEPLLKDALAMWKRLFPGDRPAVAWSLGNLAVLNWDRGKTTDAEPLLREEIMMYDRADVLIILDRDGRGT